MFTRLCVLLYRVSQKSGTADFQYLAGQKFRLFCFVVVVVVVVVVVDIIR